METPFWIDINLETADGQIRLTALGSRGEVTAPRVLPIDLERLESFARKVGKAVRERRSLDEAALREAHALHVALFDGEFRDLSIRLAEAANGAPVLHRLVLRDRSLQAIPWEAVCEPASSEGFWSTAPSVRFARGVPSPEPGKPIEISGAVRLLAIGPSFDKGASQALHSALAGAIASGEIEWLEPITGPKVSKSYLFEALRNGKKPHIVHYVGHGGIDEGGHPVLRLSDNDDGEEEWIKVESLARELAATFADDLRLVVLEACEGARPGYLGSAAEIINRAGIYAAMAHLWPVLADVASACSRGFYRSLVTNGNVTSSLANVRRSLLLHGAEAFSPVLYMRGVKPNLFKFDKRGTAAERTPTMYHATTTGAGTMPWVTGPLMTIWKGDRAEPSHLRFDLPQKDGSVKVIKAVLDEKRRHHLGRDEKRSDDKTINDIVLPSSRVSRDAAVVEHIEGRWVLRNTSDKRRVLVNMSPLNPGEECVLTHGANVMIADIGGTFVDGRFYPMAPMTAADPLTGLLSHHGINCEVALVLAARKPRTLVLIQFSADDIRSAGIATRVLHEADPKTPIGLIGTTVTLLVENEPRADTFSETLCRVGLVPRAAGLLRLNGSCVEAGVQVDAALGSLTRWVTAGRSSGLIDLARYALPIIEIDALERHARNARAAGGGVGLVLLDETERFQDLDGAVRAAIELELRENIGSLLGKDDRLVVIGTGTLAVVAHQPIEVLLRNIARSWRARGPMILGALEINRSLRMVALNEATTSQLVRQGEDFTRELAKGTNAVGLPTPIAYWLDAAQQATTTAERALAQVRTIEMMWKLLGCVLVASFWALRKKETLPSNVDASSWPPWRANTLAAAEALRNVEGRIGELAEAVCQVALPAKGVLALASSRAMHVSSLLAAPSLDVGLLEQASSALEFEIQDVCAALRSLRGWSLVAVREAEQLDVMGTSSHVEYVDFTCPYEFGVHRRHTISGIRIFPFVYFVRWTEGIAIPLEPLVRRISAGGHDDTLVMIDATPSSAGQHEYGDLKMNVHVRLSVTEKQLSR